MGTTRTRVLAAICALVLFPLFPGTAAADPSRETVEARHRLDKLNLQVAVATERYDASRIRLAVAARAADAARIRVATKEAALAQVQDAIGQIAAAAYRAGGAEDVFQLVLGGDAQSFLDRASTLDVVSRRRDRQLSALRVARRSVRIERERARQQAAAASRIAADLARTRTEIERAVGQQKVLLAKLESADARRERLAREAAARRAAQLAAAGARARALAAAEAARRASRSRPGPVFTGPVSGRADAAVREAYQQLGKPYEWGAEGPNSFDCSGLTMWAWAKAGVSLPHSSQMQFDQGRHVGRDELRPGDLVFFGSPIHHVGIYVGSGDMINAPQTGDVVKVAPAFRDDYVGAVRL